MLETVRGHYDGTHIVMEENVKLTAGQEVIITILDAGQQTRPIPDLNRYMGRGPKMFHDDAQEYVKELRKNDRI